MNSSRTWMAAIALFTLTGMTGCLPGVTWLPDSSGFIYTGGRDGQDVVYFDVATKRQRTILTDAKLKNFWPAISPDGKTVAVARISHDKDKGDSIQILFCDLNGKAGRKSQVFSIRGAKDAKPGDSLMPSLFWGPPDKIVLSVSAERFNTVGIYDVDNDKLKIVKDASASAIAGRPTRPDGKGFVVTHWNNKDFSGISFVDWDGNERAIAMKPPIRNDQDRQEMLMWPYMFTSSWDGPKAFVSTSKARFEIDTDKLQCKIDSLDAGEPNGESIVRQQFVFPGSHNLVRIVNWTKQVKGTTEQKARLEVLDAHQKKMQMLLEEGFLALFPSPNGKLVAVRYARDDKKPGEPKEMIWVIDQSGQVLAKVKVQD